jgi:hypothetical protein
MQLAAPHQAPGDVGRLQRSAFGRRMGHKVAGDRNHDVPALVSTAPLSELSDSRLQHLIHMEACEIVTATLTLWKPQTRPRGRETNFTCFASAGQCLCPKPRRIRQKRLRTLENL